jgi:adhesin transport system membrane fusion protein
MTQNTKRRRSPEQAPSYGLWAVALVLLVLGGWAYLAEIEQTTRAQGQVIPSSRLQIIQSLDGGVINEVMVKQGDRVEKGQLLVRLDKTKLEAAFFEAQGRVAALSANLARVKAEVFGGSPQFQSGSSKYIQFQSNQLQLLAKRRTAITQEIANLNQMLELANKELAMNQPLLKTGDVSLADVLRLQRTVADLQSQIVNRQNKYNQDTQAELAKVEEDFLAAEQTMAQRRDQMERTEIYSPMSGTVKNVRLTTVGAVARAAEEILQVVPLEDTLIIEARVRPADVAFLKPGQAASVKIDAYDYTVYGSLEGNLTYISADTLAEDLKQGEQAYYRVQIQTKGRHFSARPKETLEIQAGMTATVEITTGRNTVLRYLIKPAIKTLSESLGER